MRIEQVTAEYTFRYGLAVFTHEHCQSHGYCAITFEDCTMRNWWVAWHKSKWLMSIAPALKLNVETLLQYKPLRCHIDQLSSGGKTGLGCDRFFLHLGESQIHCVLSSYSCLTFCRSSFAQPIRPPDTTWFHLWGWRAIEVCQCAFICPMEHKWSTIPAKNRIRTSWSVQSMGVSSELKFQGETNSSSAQLSKRKNAIWMFCR